MYEEGRGKSLVLDLLYLLNVGSDAGELIGLVFAPQVGSRAAYKMFVFGSSAPVEYLACDPRSPYFSNPPVAARRDADHL
mgnify:CR=1 FL=1